MRRIGILLFLLLPLIAQAAEPDAAEYDASNWGVSFGAPGFLNINASVAFESATIMFSAGYGFLVVSEGVEIGATIMRWPRSDTLRSLQVILGEHREEASTFNNDIKEWRYIGVGATLRWRSFFIEPALTVGEGDFSSPLALLKIGWLWDM